jgi:4'-phosphopantetheinyl transferase
MLELKFAHPSALLHTTRRCNASPAEIHLWAFDLDADAALVAHARTMLSLEEHARADRFVFAEDRMHYTLAHAVLRHLLSAYADVAPAMLEFCAGAAGKPSLSGPSCATPLSFNLSHSHGRALLAVSMRRELGVDLEKIRPEVSGRDISEQFFSDDEWAVIGSAATDEVARTFFRHWVAKEAVLKAQGVGLGFELDRFSVLFSADWMRATVESRRPEQLSPEWQVRMLDAGADWTAAVCAEGEDWRAVALQWS